MRGLHVTLECADKKSWGIEPLAGGIQLQRFVPARAFGVKAAGEEFSFAKQATIKQ
jgi:hypothetical protein